MDFHTVCMKQEVPLCKVETIVEPNEYKDHDQQTTMTVKLGTY